MEILGRKVSRLGLLQMAPFDENQDPPVERFYTEKPAVLVATLVEIGSFFVLLAALFLDSLVLANVAVWLVVLTKTVVMRHAWQLGQKARALNDVYRMLLTIIAGSALFYALLLKGW